MTGSMSWMLALIGVELVALVLVLLGLSWFRSRAARRRDAKAMQALVARVRTGRADREKVLRRFLEGRLGLSGGALAAATAGLLRAELTVLHRFAGIYRRRDAGSAAQFDIDLQTAIEPYHGLSADPGAEPAPESPEVEVDESEIRRLREENQRLSDELQITMETMSRMLNEYSTMFSSGQPADPPPIGAPSVAAVATPEVAAAGQRPTVGPGSDESVDEGIEVVTDDPEPTGGSVPQIEAIGDSLQAKSDDDMTIDPAVDDANDRDTQRSDAGPVEHRTSVEPVADGGAISLFDAVEPPPASDAPPSVNDVVEPGMDESLSSSGGVNVDGPFDDKGGDLEAVSSMLVAGDSELLMPDGAVGDESTGGGLFDEMDDAMFDADGPSEDAALPSRPVDDLDKIDDLFDPDDPLMPASAEEAGQGAR